MKIGILADWLGQSFEGNILKAAQLGADGIQMYCVDGELAPENMDSGRRSFVRKFVSDNGLEISAVCGDLGGGGFSFAERNPEKIRRTKAIVDLALDLNCRIITTHIGVVPHDPAHPRYGIIRDAMGELGTYAASRGAVFAIETGPEPSADLKNLLDDLNCPGIGVNMDPANLIMCHDESPVLSVNNLGKYIVHTHAKDGVLYKHCDMEIMYGIVPAPEDYDEADYCAEVPLGEGNVHFDTYLPALVQSGFDGYLTIERECGPDPAADIAIAIGFLRRQLQSL